MSTTPDPSEPSPGTYLPPPPPPGAFPSSGPPPRPGTPPPYGGAAPAGYPPSAYGPALPLSPSDQRTWAVVSHLGGVFVSFLVPLVVWLVFRGRGAYLEDQAKEALNFQITLVLGYLIGAVTLIILVGAVITPLVYVFGVVMAIVAAVAAGRGDPYRYPLTLRLIR